MAAFQQGNTVMKGKTNNPGGINRTSRQLLTAKFIRTVARDFEEHGEKCLRKLREKDVATYVKVVASLIPKETTLDANIQVSHDHVVDFLNNAITEKVIESTNIGEDNLLNESIIDQDQVKAE